jgi:hypothetical protein
VERSIFGGGQLLQIADYGSGIEGHTSLLLRQANIITERRRLVTRKCSAQLAREHGWRETALPGSIPT